MRIYLIAVTTLFLFNAFCCSSAVGQGLEKDSIEQYQEVIIDPIEIMPRFPGGEAEMRNYIKQKLIRDNIPDSVKGRVFVEFVVEKSGEVTDVRVIKGLCIGCDKEAIRLVTSMPQWTPGTQMGKIIRTRMVLPIVF